MRRVTDDGLTLSTAPWIEYNWQFYLVLHVEGVVCSARDVSLLEFALAESHGEIGDGGDGCIDGADEEDHSRVRGISAEDVTEMQWRKRVAYFELRASRPREPQTKIAVDIQRT